MSLRPRLAAFVTFATLTAGAAVVSAQPGAPPPPPPPGYGDPYGGGYYPPPAPPPTERRGLTLGFGFSLGSLEADSGPLRCDGCNYDPIAGGFDFHIGAMLQPRLALQGEFQFLAINLDSDGYQSLYEAQLFGALQYWLTDMLWIKGGLGISSVGISTDDGYEGQSEELDSGGAVLAAIGYEVLHSTRFAIDLQLRLTSAVYSGLEDEMHSAQLGVGFNWY